MAYYTNINPNSRLAGVEFFPRAEGNFAFFYAKSSEDAERLRPELSRIGQKVLDAAPVNGQFVLITEGDKSQHDLTAALEPLGERLRPKESGVEFHPWKWRGHFSDVGQGLNLLSSVRKLQQTGKGLDAPKLMFAGLNLTANWVNKEYGAQKRQDDYQLRYLKGRVNDGLKPYLPSGTDLPDIDEDRAELRKGPQRPKTVSEKFDTFMRRNSVRIGEIGLRYLGSIAMVFDITQFKKMGQVIGQGHIINEFGKQIPKEIIERPFKWGRAFETMKSRPVSTAFGLLNENKTNLYTGAIYLLGKSIGLVFARSPDPYNPKPKTAFDTFREEYAFRISSLIETGAAATLMVGSFRKGDPIGGMGGASLVGGLATRFFAPFGVREVNREELYAHVVDSLARMPRDKVPDLLAKTSALLKDHFRENPETYGQIFTDLRNKLYKEHGIAVYADEVCAATEKQPPAVMHSEKIAPPVGYVEKLQQAQPQPLQIS